MRSTLVEEGMAALRAGDTAAARRAFELALAEVESGEALEGLGRGAATSSPRSAAPTTAVS